uniref:Protein kinase domain-containing protein n=1 Tax=Davidia involucrata TaxID=16924 RepID=A0A5B7B2A9_DAVIN
MIQISTPLYLIICFTSLMIMINIPIACNSQALYKPTDSIALDCGSSGESTSEDGREWVGDMMIGSQVLYSKTIEQQPNTSIYSSAQKPPHTKDAVPYFTARVFRSDFTYVFPVTTSGQKFIRLHFYPSTTYQSFDRSKAFFSVIANGFTLLNNFNASLTEDSLGLDTIEKEYSINVEEEDQSGGLQVNLTFTPTSSDHDAYAFINGIEIVSMPTNLYYNNPELTFIDHQQNNPFPLENTTALEMLYRFNVGAQTISPMQDTGMFRTWSPDDDYCSNVGALPVNQNFQPSFTKIPNYTAPALVYQTARSMGNNKTINVGYNLTWNLPVDPGFTYMIRLHFCEFQIQVTQSSDREFTIFITNETADAYADVITWSGGSRVPVFRDYAVLMGGTDNHKQINLSVALHPNSPSRTRHSDAILNGLEVFKLSDPTRNLAGLNPNVPVGMTPPPSTPQPKTKSKRTTTFVIAIVVGVLSGVIALSFLAFLTFRHQRKAQDGGSSHGFASWWRSFSYVAAKPTNTGGSNSHLPSDLCRHFSLAEIKTATNNFDSIFIIGRGGFGDVYKGYIDGGATPVAIKRLKPDSRQGAHEFKTEIEMLSHLRHLHLVSLIGYCNEAREMILVYDYMSRGTLRDHLFDTENPPLSWKQRLEICIGASRGLHYLHAGAKQRIIHRDVKTSNILLDDKWVAKVSDFGLSKINPTDMSNTHISTVVKGSLGYLDPEYYRRQQLTEKSDVYSFGVVLFEVLCARPPLNNLLEKEKVNLAGWARLCYENGTLDQIIDPHLMGKIVPGCLKKFGEIAVNCVHDEGIKRPSMNDVVWSLEFALQLQEGAEEGIDFQIQEFKDKDVHGQDKKVEDRSGQVSSSGVTMTSKSGTSFTSYGSEAMSSGAVFSEIGIPKGR